MSKADILERHRKGLYPYNPARAIARAYINGLSALKDLFYRRGIKSIKSTYTSTQNKWSAALDKWRQSKRQGNPDFSPITEVERHMRRNFNKMIWETTARYGNTKYKRIQNERKGKVGPLNRLLNMAGAQIRNHAVIRYPFPEPETVGRRGRRPIAGFEGGNNYPWVEVAHITLPELDFADMIRPHVFELCRKCFINDVPVNDARRYVNLLIQRLSPFLDYLYTSGETGRWGFRRSKKKNGRDPTQPDAEQILREIVDEIETFYGTHNGKPLPVTQVLSKPQEQADMSFFLDQVRRLKYPKEKVPAIEQERRDTWADFLKDLCIRDILRDADTQYLQKETTKRARWYGIKWHRLLTNGLVQPYNLRTIVLGGDRWAKEGDAYLIAAEIPITTPLGNGRADIVIFKRFVIPNPRIPRDPVVWKPVAVFDIKSKTAFNWEIKAEEKKSKKYGKKVVPKFLIRRRGLTDAEWDGVIASTPDEYGKKQLEAYAKGLVQEYEKITGDKTLPNPISGTVILDISQDSALVRKRFWQLLHAFYTKAPSTLKKRLNQHVQIKLKRYDWLKLSLVLRGVEEEQVELLLSKGDVVREPELYNPLADSENEDTRFIFYLSTTSASRSGPTAAWIARYWHGLEYLYELSKSMNDAEIIWLDISGDFSYQPLAETRFRLNRHKPHIREFYRKIRIEDVSKMVSDYLYRGKEIPSFSPFIDKKSKQKQIVVFSGWDVLDNSTPRRLWSALSELKNTIARELRKIGHVVVWFTKPRTAEDTSSLYQCRSFNPFYPTSSLRYHATEIIWNLPVKPYASGQRTPIFDELRVIAKQTKSDVTFNLVEVPVLKSWSPKFWNQSPKQRTTTISTGVGREPITAEDVLKDEALRSSLIQDSLEIIPWMKSLYSTVVAKQKPQRRGQRIIVESIKTSTKQKQTSIPRLRYRAIPRGAKWGSSHVPSASLVPKKRLTFYRRYRNDGVKEKVITQNHRPPFEQTLSFQGFDVRKASKIEIKRLRQAIRITSHLQQPILSETEESDWRQFLVGLKDIISNTQVGIDDYEVLGDVVSYLETNELTAYLWREFYWIRERWMLKGLNQEARASIQNLKLSWPALQLKFGNYLFLLILALKLKYRDLDKSGLSQLFRSIWPWQLTQLGLNPGQNAALVGTSTFDMREVWTELTKRAASLTGIHVKEPPTIQLGQIITSKDQEKSPYYWLIVQDSKYKKRIVSGFWRGANPFLPSNTIHWTESRHDIIAKTASIPKDMQELYDVMIIQYKGREYLCLYEDQEWSFVSEIQIIRRHREAVTGILGIRMISDQLLDNVVYPEGAKVTNQVKELIRNELEFYSTEFENCLPVKCEIYLESEEYVVRIQNPTDKYDIYEQRTFHKTSKLLDFLRIPITLGIPVQSSMNSKLYYTWNPYEDIAYTDMKIIRPYVERRTPFIHIHAPLPLNAKEITNRKKKELRLIVTHDTRLCPLVQGTGEQHGACWRIEFSDDDNPYLKSMRKRAFNDDELVLLLKSGGLFLVSAYYEFSYRFEPYPEGIYGIEFRESRQIAKLLGMKWVKPGSFLHIDTETDL